MCSEKKGVKAEIWTRTRIGASSCTHFNSLGTGFEQRRPKLRGALSDGEDAVLDNKLIKHAYFKAGGRSMRLGSWAVRAACCFFSIVLFHSGTLILW